MRAEAVEHRLDRRPCLACASCEAANHWEEFVAAERLKPELDGCPDRGRPWDPPQQRDLPEPFTASERCDQAAVSDHLGLTRHDHVKAIAHIALMEHDVAGRYRNRFQPARELFDGGEGQGPQQGNRM